MLVFKDITVTPHPRFPLVPGRAKPELLRKRCYHRPMRGETALRVRWWQGLQGNGQLLVEDVVEFRREGGAV